MAYISSALRQQVTIRAHGLCEYCQTAQIIVIALEIDHIKPESAGGPTIFDNLALICSRCNQAKYKHQTGLDPLTAEITALFNPRVQLWKDHFRWNSEGTHIIGLTASGRATIERLRMNRDEMIVSRRIWVSAGWHPPRTD